MKKLIYSKWRDIDLTLDNNLEIFGTKQMTWQFKISKNTRNLIIRATQNPDINNGKIKYCYRLVKTEDLFLEKRS